MEEKINKKIIEIKSTIKEITKHFNYTEKEINLLTISYLSIIMLDDEVEDLLMEVLSKTYILFTTDTVLNTYQRLKQREIAEPLFTRLKESSSAYFGYEIIKDKIISENLIIISLKKEMYMIFDNLIHELKHAMNEVFPVFCETKKPYFYFFLAEGTKQEMIYEAIDEAFNSYLVKLYLDNITFLKQFKIEDSSIQKILLNYKVPQNYSFAYEKIVNICLPIFESQFLFNKLYYSTLYKDFDELDKAFHEVLGHTKDSIDFFLDLDEYLRNEKEMIEIEELDHSYLRKRIKIKPYIK